MLPNFLFIKYNLLGKKSNLVKSTNTLNAKVLFFFKHCPTLVFVPVTGVYSKQQYMGHTKRLLQLGIVPATHCAAAGAQLLHKLCCQVHRVQFVCLFLLHIKMPEL